ncbi:MAG TPA: MqnA/MqnD/SBP family protein [Rubricoccaceae bacterium]|nr:MqnA/MqnD/SBP family protein [Rubricoccaceae bacterium]
MRLAVWPVAPARALGAALRGAGPVTEVAEVGPFEAAAAVRGGHADLALVPTLDVLRDPDAFALVPGVGLVGERCPTVRLAVAAPLDAVRTVAFDPRYAQEVLLTQLLLREHYGGEPAFVPADPAAPLAERLAGRDAALVAPEEPVGEGVTVLDLGQEWAELTLRPMVWGLVAARAGALDAATARALADAVAALPPPDEADAEARHYQLTLDGYALAGLDELVNHLYYHRVLDDLPALPFVELPDEEEE